MCVVCSGEGGVHVKCVWCVGVRVGCMWSVCGGEIVLRAITLSLSLSLFLSHSHSHRSSPCDLEVPGDFSLKPH